MDTNGHKIAAHIRTLSHDNIQQTAAILASFAALAENLVLSQSELEAIVGALRTHQGTMQQTTPPRDRVFGCTEGKMAALAESLKRLQMRLPQMAAE